MSSYGSYGESRYVALLCVSVCLVKAVMESCVLVRLCALRYVWLWQLWFGAACFVPFCYGSLGEVCQVVAS